MELLQLKYFCDAAMSENFSHTAKKHGLPTSAISQTVKRLENELGTELFDRSSNKIKLNAKGKAFYSAVHKALNDIEAAKAKIDDNDGEISGNIKLLVCTNRRLVTKAIEKFKTEYPKVSFLLQHSAGSQQDDFDLCIDDAFFNSPAYEQYLLLTENILLAIRSGHPLEKMKVITPALLKNESFITMTDASSLYRLTKQICKEAGFEPNITIQCDDPFYLRRYVQLGLGVAFVPERSWQGLFPKDVIFKSVGKFKRNTYFYTNKGKPHTRTVQVFTQMLKDTFAEEK